MDFLEFLKILIIGAVEGLTEWLPVGSDIHLFMFRELLGPDMNENFSEVFQAIIRLGSVFSVVLLFWNRIRPFGKDKNQSNVSIPVIALWVKVFAACLPALIIGTAFKSTLNDFFYSGDSTLFFMSIFMILYGVVLVRIEGNSKTAARYSKLSAMPLKLALYLGFFQFLALIPGTSVICITIIGALLFGMGRGPAAEFGFYVSSVGILVDGIITIIRYIHENGVFTGNQTVILMAGTITAFMVSFYTIRLFTDFIKRHDYRPFGYYRIAAGIAVLIYYTVK